MTNISIYAIFITVDVYSYATIGNRDRLISFNDERFTYNELGNPICYRNHTLSWERMSLLASYDGNTFEYNASGIRCKKNNTVYTLSGKRILKETNGSNTIVYYYGVNGVVGFNYNGTDYYYGRNLLGDITEIYTAAGIKVASYVYDAWGVCTIVSDTSNCNISAINPFRYRGYYFDTETNLYYLETRYYDPQIGRFISQDSTKYLDPETIGGFNLYAYCFDNPVMCLDPNGSWPKWFETAAKITAVVLAVAATVAVIAVASAGTGGAAAVVAATAFGAAWGGLINGYANESNGESFFNGWGVGMATGAAKGFLTVTCPGGSIAWEAVASGTTSMLIDAVNNIGKSEQERIDIHSMIKKAGHVATIGAISALVTRGIDYGIDFAQNNPSGYNAWASSLKSGEGITPITDGFAKALSTFWTAVWDTITTFAN